MRRIIVSASKEDDEGHWLSTRAARRSWFQGAFGADADARLSRKSRIPPANVQRTTGGAGLLFPTILASPSADSAIGDSIFRDAVPCEGRQAAHFIATAMWGANEQETLRGLDAWNQQSIGCVVGSKDFDMEALCMGFVAWRCARSLQGVHSGPSNRHRLQTSTNLEHHPARTA